MKLFMILLAAVDFTLCRVDPLYKVIPGDSTYVETQDTILVARGENATVQLVVNNSSTDTLANPRVKVRFRAGKAKTGWVHNVACYNRPFRAPDLLHSSDDTFPDPIIDDTDETIAPGQRGIIWADIAIPRNAEPGVYKGCVKVKANGRKVRKPFIVKIYPVTLPEEQGLTVVQWYYENSLKWMNGGEPVEKYSDKYYECLQAIAGTAAEYGQNCWLIKSQPELVPNADSTGFTLDFTQFDRTVEMLMQYGNLRTITFGHFGGRKENSEWSDEFEFNGYEWADGELKHFITDVSDPRLETYINTYYPLLEAHLREKGWLGIYCQHIADEPSTKGTPSYNSWVTVARMIKQAAPGIKTIDASTDILEFQDITVPVLGESIAGFKGAPEGGERWMYTCTVPQYNYANRFIHQPLLKPRLVHWVNWRYDTTGYLHWGLNWWEGCTDPMHDTTPCTDWPCGDCYIIYPGDGKVYPSIRLCAMRDGIRDFDLLKMGEAKDSVFTKSLIDSVVYAPDNYVSDIAAFRRIRKSLLDFLAE